MNAQFFADLHIHSKFSIAASKETSIAQLSSYAILKGISLLGTGDFTHPLWFKEITSNLEEADGFLQHKKSFAIKKTSSQLESKAHKLLTKFGHAPPLFTLQTEVATISKIENKTKKVHHIVLLPSIKAVERFAKKINKYGNLNKDGRAMLKLSPSSLLEIAFDVDAFALVVPAHIWTPWYSVLGEKSGFNSIEECYGNLSKYIFALETGLSSNPAMNRKVSSLDKYVLLSNSDAHSPQKIGRECSIFRSQLTYRDVYYAIKTGIGFAGTIEHFAETGKYYLDGHRKCNFFVKPDRMDKNKSLCPVCGKKLTQGVMHRIENLADRDVAALPAKERPFFSTPSLPEIDRKSVV
jgi:DNA helicase-2/ATP-dependent DNA helicase PcrA